MYRSKVKFSFIMFLVLSDYCELNDSYGVGRYGSDWMYFPDGDGVPRIIDLLPPNRNVGKVSLRIKRDVEFRLYTKENALNYTVLNELIINEEFETIKGIFNNSDPIKVVTHGWMSNADKGGVIDIVNAYLQAPEHVTVITVDWSSYSMNYFYFTVANETRDVAKIVAQFLDLICNRFNISGDRLHLIGHSLGAHVMGIAGFESTFRVGRITGLDPALPMFKNIQKVKHRLDYDDASFVDVIHTCGGVLGFWDAIGHVDFYPNNGKAPQPGCQSFNIIQFEACSHGRAILYFAESILNTQAFPSYYCESWDRNLEQNCPLIGFMGEGASSNMSGILYLQTNSKEPFGRKARNLTLT